MILKLKVLLSPFIYLFLIFNIPPAQAVDLCIEGKKQLSRDYQLMQINGGLLALMMQTDSLKNSASLFWRLYVGRVQKQTLPLRFTVKSKKELIEETFFLIETLGKPPLTNT